MTTKDPIERRITIRLLAYWEKIRGEHPMPTEEDIDPDQIPDLWDHCFLIHVRDLGANDYNYTYLGQAIADAYKHGLSDEEQHGIVSPNAGKLLNNYKQVIDQRKPMVEDGDFRNLRNELVKYRQCLMPLGKDGQVIAIFGGMRFRISPGQ